MMESSNFSFQVTFQTKEGIQKKGPLYLLWNLIQSYEVNIFEVSLSRITNDFIAYIYKNKFDPEESSSFILMAAKLIHYKSRSLLPNDESEDESIQKDIVPKELIQQLLEYKSLQTAAEYLNELEINSNISLPIEPSWQKYATGLDFLRVDMISFLKIFQNFLLNQEEEKKIEIEHEEIIVEDAIQELYQKLLELKCISFLNLIQDIPIYKKIGFFLALLEMVFRKKIKAIQNSYETDIEIFLI